MPRRLSPTSGFSPASPAMAETISGSERSIQDRVRGARISPFRSAAVAVIDSVRTGPRPETPSTA